LDTQNGITMRPNLSIRSSIPMMFSAILLVVVMTGGVAAVDTVSESPHIEPSTVDTTEPDSIEKSETAEESVNVSLVSTTDSVTPGEDVAYDVVVTGADSGLSSYDVTVNLSDEDIASIVDAEPARDSGFGDETISENGSSVNLERALGDDTFDPAEELTIGTVTVSAEAVGNTSLTVVDDSELNDLDSDGYEIETTPLSHLEVAEDVSKGTLTVEPATGSAVIDFTRSYDIVLQNAEGGVSSFDLSVSVDSPSVAKIVDAETTGDDVIDNATIDDDGQTLTITQAQLDDTIEADDEVVLATADIEMQALGTVSVNIDDGTVNDLDGESYAVSTESGEIEVIEPPEGPDVTDDGSSATDTTGDGRTNDVTGSGQFEINDVQELFNLITSGEIETIEEADEYFDFTDDDNVGIGDVQELFTQYTEET